jgi:hypothetical protein
MAVGETQAAFGRAAARDGIVLSYAALEGLTDAGHIGLPEGLGAVAEQLRAIFRALRGDEADLASGAQASCVRPDRSPEALPVGQPRHRPAAQGLTRAAPS